MFIGQSDSRSLAPTLKQAAENVVSRFNRSSSVWQWTDTTTALYYNISKPALVSPPYCAAFDRHENHLHIIRCDRHPEADYLCEIPSATDQQSQSDIVLPVPVTPAITIPGMMECQDQSAAWQFLGCGVSSFGRASRGTTPCPHDRRDQDSLWFQCRDNGGCVPYTLVCDHRQDCADGSDEDFCVFQPCDETQMACDDKKQVSASLTRSLSSPLFYKHSPPAHLYSFFIVKVLTLLFFLSFLLLLLPIVHSNMTPNTIQSMYGSINHSSTHVNQCCGHNDDDDNDDNNNDNENDYSRSLVMITLAMTILKIGRLFVFNPRRLRQHQHQPQE